MVARRHDLRCRPRQASERLRHHDQHSHNLQVLSPALRRQRSQERARQPRSPGCRDYEGKPRRCRARQNFAENRRRSNHPVNSPAPILPEIVLIRRPLMRLETASYLLALPEREAMARVEDGRLSIAWDVRCRSSRAVCARVLARCINGPVPESAAYAWLPSFNPSVSRLAQLLDVNTQHIRYLIKDGFLLESGARRHRHEAQYVCRSSLLKFLKSRRLADLTYNASGAKTLSKSIPAIKTRCSESSKALHNDCVNHSK